jgi:hypothetical protein
LRELQEAHFGNARDQRKVQVLQALLIRKGSGFETLAHLLLLSMSQFAFKQGLQVAQIPSSPLFRLTGSRLTIPRHSVEAELLEIGHNKLSASIFCHDCTSSKRL